MDDVISLENRGDKEKRVKELRWQVEPRLMLEDKWFLGVFVVIEFVIFLFLNEQKEVSGPKDAYPGLYYAAIMAIFLLILIIINAFHTLVMGDRRGRSRTKINGELKKSSEVPNEDPEYKEILEAY